MQYKKIFPEKDLLKAKLDVLDRTAMVDFAGDVACALSGSSEVPAELKKRRGEVISNLKSVYESARPMLNFLSEPSLVQRLKQDKQFNLQFLRDEFQVGTEQIDALFHLAKAQFDSGNYKEAVEHLQNFRSLTMSRDKNFSALWGKLACDILMQRWDHAWEGITRLREAIDNKNFATPLNQMTQRSWLMHWALFVFFNHEAGRAALIDLFFQDIYMNAIQTGEPRAHDVWLPPCIHRPPWRPSLPRSRPASAEVLDLCRDRHPGPARGAEGPAARDPGGGVQLQGPPDRLCPVPVRQLRL